MLLLHGPVVSTAITCQRRGRRGGLPRPCRLNQATARFLPRDDYRRFCASIASSRLRWGRVLSTSLTLSEDRVSSLLAVVWFYCFCCNLTSVLLCKIAGGVFAFWCDSHWFGISFGCIFDYCRSNHLIWSCENRKLLGHFLRAINFFC